MPRFCANLTFLFNEHGFVERFAAAAKAGFKAVEYMSPYEYGKDELVDQLKRHGLEQILFNLPAGDWAKGERGIACHPDRVGEFQDGIGKAIEYAKALNCRQVNCLAGLCPDAPEDRQRAAFVANLKFAALKLKEAGVKLLVEPINTIDIPGFYLTGSKQALGIIDEVGSDNLFLQYDVYHMQVMEGDLARTIEKHLRRIAHMQLADNPGRNEPGTGEINYDFLFGHIDRIGYEGWIGCEYKPKAGTANGLGWVQRFLAGSAR
jgi:hydroxypyruvate isomerase